MPRPRRLDYGEGTVYWDDRYERWRGEFRAADGRRRRVSGATETEATKRLIVRRRELDLGIAEGDTRLGEWIDWWLANINPAKSPNTAANYTWALSQLSDGIRRKRLRDVKVADVEAELGRLATRGSSKRKTRGTNPRSLNRTSLAKIRRSLGSVITEAERRDMVDRNVAKLAHLPVGANGSLPRRALSAEEAEALMTAARDDGPWYALVVVSLYYGLRPGEITGLPWSALDLKEGTITVNQSRKVLPGGKMAIGATKTHSDRVLALYDVVWDALLVHQQRQRDDRRSTPAWEDHGLVFPNDIGGPLDPSNLRRAIDRLCKLAEIDPVSPNELRHTAATLLVDTGMRLEEVADFLGHKDTSMLIETYRHRAKRVVDLTEGQKRMLGDG